MLELSAAERQRPTLEDIRKWPATVNVTLAASAIGVSRAHLYEALKRDDAPIRAIRVGKRTKVVTSSILALLDDPESGTAA